MRRYQRYLIEHLLWPTVMITASLTGIIWLTQVLRFIDFMLNRGLTLGDFLYLTGLMLPSLLLILIPISLAIAVLYTYHKLSGDSELTVFSAVGISRLQLALPAVKVGAIAMLICYALSLYLMPVSRQHFQDIRTFFRDKYASVLLEEEVFNSPIDGLTVFVRKRDRENNLYGILIHDNRDFANPLTMMASRGRLQQTPAGPRFYLEEGLRQEMKDGRINWLSFENYLLDIGFYGQDVARERAPDERTIGQLFATENIPPAKIPVLRAEAHQRLTWPLLCLALPLLVLATLFAGEFNRRGQWKRIILAAALSAGLVILFFALRSLMVQHYWVTVLLYLLVLGSAAASLKQLASDRRGRWRWRGRHAAATQVPA
jgi:lipopolysaccharide export system permease protein